MVQRGLMRMVASRVTGCQVLAIQLRRWNTVACVSLTSPLLSSFIPPSILVLLYHFSCKALVDIIHSTMSTRSLHFRRERSITLSPHPSLPLGFSVSLSLSLSLSSSSLSKGKAHIIYTYSLAFQCTGSLRNYH